MSPVAMDVATDTVEVESPPSITRTTSWASLPVEVRQMILRFVCLPISRGEYNGLSSLKVARFATVCLEWQAFFEARTFRRLVLDPGSLGDFDTIVGRHDARLGYIRKLWLRVRLSKYECPDCDEPEDRAAQHWHVRASISPALIPEYSVLINSRSNNMIFTTCIQSLLGTLRLWDPARHGAQGLALMLSASSPSDTGHRFNRCEITDSYPFHYAEDLDPARSIVDYHRANMVDPFNGYLHRDWLPPLSGGHIKRAQGTPLRLEPQNGERGRYISQSKSLPAVPMIKGLVMRRQYCRDIHIKTLSWLIGRSFVALEWFRFERTISLEAHKQFSFDQGMKRGPVATSSI